jgi:hypothetical protein
VYSHAFSSSDLCQRLGQRTAAAAADDSHVAPIVSVFDELKDYLSDSDLSLDYKLARQRRKHTRKSNAAAAGARSLNRQAQLASLIQANRKAAEGNSSRGLAAPAPKNDADHGQSINSGLRETPGTTSDNGQGISETASLPAVPQRKTCAVTGHPRGRSLEPISEESQQLAADDSGRSESISRNDLTTNSTSNSSSILTKNNDHSISASVERKERPESNFWYVENPYDDDDEPPAAKRNTSDQSRPRSADQQLTVDAADRLSSCALVSAAQNQLQTRGQQQDRTFSLSDTSKSTEDQNDSPRIQEGKL